MTSTIVAVTVALVLAWAADRWRRRRSWGGKSTEELWTILSAAEWRKWELALGELRRRSHDTSGAIAVLSDRLLSQSNFERAAARIVLMKLCPETRPFLKDYHALDDEPTRRLALAPFLEKYKLNARQAAEVPE